ncbi:MAG: YbgC/FadM family acyl-CoA thioesterase [Hydrogenophaga sp.]|jgi:YbgC/YbaW family acyl-CoA thioester hydrolase|uniref:YbgC/FadM family acyl-CoA thioesterase n=1 Tax=Hydrogenophaga sp. TaxID=1904254 RepID=UPI000EC5B662|nr:YbgC/FadM family acyl-CoA thioesterase [Hydrogenophaga sp.]MDD3785119.1 YbgC/FadM family acyl-CoA thioesterase [Hydrogenophaga sp.]MDX9968735.1 YbgC/FadM family acyl-CoA thioesterase [Hydrogenophaga sp.]HAJ13136.1 4-hydroxybenzoyl-CoA thioesterase [Comamonadaceae bacterium]
MAAGQQRSDFRLFHRLRVRWAEVDMQKIVFNAHYLMYFDTAITDYWRALALPYEAAMHRLGGDLYVVKATVEYHASARVDDRLDVAIRCSRIGNSSLTFTGAIFRDEQQLISSEIIYVFADPATQTSRPVPAALRDALLGYEGGETMLRAQVGTWADLGEEARAIRQAVFVQEQGIPAELACDVADAGAVHVLVRNRLGMPVGTGRLLPADIPGDARVGRVAVDHAVRGARVGLAVMQALEEAARSRGDRRIVLHAQRSAVPFYDRLGYQRVGEPFDEAGIPHQEMVKLV